MVHEFFFKKEIKVIDSKKSLLEYLAADRLIQPEPKNPLKCLFGAQVVRLKTHLRKAEYHHNIGGGWHRIAYYWHLLRLKKLSSQFCSEIPINVFGKGLVIWHPERIIVNPQSKVGDYCSLSSGVVIAQAHDQCPVIGNHVELMIDSKVLGGINVADHTRVGANALVLKDISEPDTTWAGVPAHKISDRGTIETPTIPVQSKHEQL